MSSNDQNDSYRAVFDAINEAVFIHDADTGAILEANQAMSTMYGYAPDEITDLTVGDLSSGEPPYHQTNAIKYVEAVLNTGFQMFEWHAKKRDGRLFWVEVSLSPARVGGQRRVVAVVRDCTQRKQAELVHKETQRLLKFTQLTVHQAKIAIFWCHSSGFFFYVNDTACEWLQYSREELMTMHVADINPEFPRDNWPAHWQEIKDQGLVQMESVHRRKNGDIYPVEIFSNYVQFEGEEYKLGFVHDITAQKQAEEEKTILKERLRQAQRIEAIGTLAGGIAHDLNNMLSPILGYAEMLIKDLSESSDHQIKLKEIFKAAARARNLTRQLLTFGRKQPLNIRPLSLNQVIEGFEKILRRTIRENIEIKKNLEDALPSIEGDVGQIEQVVLNLAVNAQDAMPDGGTLSIETTVRYLDQTFPEFLPDGTPGYYVMMAVSDSGQGMDKDILPRIFEPFFTTKKIGQGTGLGLSTVYGIVKQHMGYLWAYSEPGEGTTFKVYLPQSEKQAEDLHQEESAQVPTGGGETILIVEDQDQVLMLATDILKTCGYHVLEACDGQSAIELVQTLNQPIQLLLTDVVMPDMNGRQLFERLVELQTDLKVLYMSGYTDDVVVHHGIVEKGIQFISKPFGVKDLATKVRESLDHPA